MIAKSVPFIVLVCVSLAPKLPFLSLGYGLDPDAYRAVSSALHLSKGEGYVASRLPGYPVHEYLLHVSSAYKAPIAANLVSLLAFTMSGVCLYLVLRKADPRTALPLSLAFATMPLSFPAATESMDYALSLFLLLLALSLLLYGRSTSSAVALGAAAASRITNGAALLAVLPLIGRREAASRGTAILWYAVAFAVSGLLFFSPVLRTYGASFLAFYDQEVRPSPFEILDQGMVGTWGHWGTAAASILLLLTVLRALREAPVRRSPIFLAGLLLALIYWAAFFRLPAETEYLLPAVVGFLMMASVALRHAWLAWAFAAVVAASSGLQHRSEGLQPGPAFSYHARRASDVDLIRCIVRRLAGLSEGATVIVPTTMEAAYFRQGVEADRPDIDFVLKAAFDGEADRAGPVYEIATSMFDRSGPGCAVAIERRR